MNIIIRHCLEASPLFSHFTYICLNSQVVLAFYKGKWLTKLDIQSFFFLHKLLFKNITWVKFVHISRRHGTCRKMLKKIQCWSQAHMLNYLPSTNIIVNVISLNSNWPEELSILTIRIFYSLLSIASMSTPEVITPN